MATERSEHQQWAQKEFDTLVDLGFNPMDSQARVDWVLANLPTGENPATYIFPPHQLWTDPSSTANILDAAAAWMSEVTPKFARLLHAKEEE